MGHGKNHQGKVKKQTTTLTEVKKKTFLLFANIVTLLQVFMYQTSGDKSLICATFMGLTLTYFTATVFYCNLYDPHSSINLI